MWPSGQKKQFFGSIEIFGRWGGQRVQKSNKQKFWL